MQLMASSQGHSPRSSADRTALENVLGIFAAHHMKLWEVHHYHKAAEHTRAW